MADDSWRLRPPVDDPEGDGSDTREYETRVSRPESAQGGSRQNRGYWIDPPSAGAPNVRAGRAGSASAGAAVDAASPEAGASSKRKRRSRKGRLVRLVVLGVIVAGIVTALALIITGRTVLPVISEAIYPIHYRAEIAQVAEEYDLDPYLVAAVVKAESGYDPEAMSSAGAVGLMQLMPETAEWIVTDLDTWRGDEDPDLIDPADNLELGACYLAYLGQSFGDGPELTLAAYNAGEGTVRGWVETAGGRQAFDVTDIQYPETREYVERVERYRLLYERIHPDAFSAAEASGAADAFSETGSSS
jgi:soluble lytic murein transglycosylase